MMSVAGLGYIYALRTIGSSFICVRAGGSRRDEVRQSILHNLVTEPRTFDSWRAG